MGKRLRLRATKGVPPIVRAVEENANRDGYSKKESPFSVLTYRRRIPDGPGSYLRPLLLLIGKSKILGFQPRIFGTQDLSSPIAGLALACAGHYRLS